MLSLRVNGASHELDVDPTTPLLWVLRDHLALTGTKYGCGMGVCGACVVHVDGEPRRSCQIAAGDVRSQSVTTIEGLSADGSHPCQRAWIELDVAQCGYCQPAMILCAASLIAREARPSDEAVERALGEQVCRCGTYSRIRRAVARAAELAAEAKK
jgi:aerobic-type carbon monoxide dehydrogenase small subunit (CoxS/CutS family)